MTDPNNHNVRSTTPSGVLNSANLANGATYSFTFNSAGTFKYRCSIHPSMLGTVNVANPPCPAHESYPLTNDGKTVTVFTCPGGLYGSKSKTCTAGKWSPEVDNCVSCPSGFTSAGGVTQVTDCTDINECNVLNGGCSSQAQCQNTVGSRTCSCNSGYFGDGIDCTDIDECSTNNGECSMNATCTNTDGSRTCSCNQGYSGDGMICSPSPCSAESIFPETQSGETANINNCPAGEYGYYSRSCTLGVWGLIINNCMPCPAGYSSPANSPTSSACSDINECEVNNGGCSMNAKCTNTIGSRTCSCPSGFTGNGITCTDINECLTNNGNCLQGTCINSDGSRTCSCFSGYTNDNGGRCVDINECRSNNGGCDPKAKCSNTDGSRICSCTSGYTGNGLVCNDINECLTNNGGCDSFATCVNTIGSRQCNCPPGYLGNGYDCSNRKLLHYAKYLPITRFSFDTDTQDEIRIGTFANVGSTQRFSIYQRNNPGNQAMRLDGDDNVIIPPVNLGVNFTFEVLFNTNTYPTSPILSDILTVMPQGKSLRSEAMLIVSIDSNGRIVRSSNGAVLSTSNRMVRVGVTHSLMVSFYSGRLISYMDGINLGTIMNFNNHVAGNSYEIQSGFNFDGYIDEIGAFNVAMGVNHLYSLTNCKNPCPTGQICVNLVNGESCAQRVF